MTSLRPLSMKTNQTEYDEIVRELNEHRLKIIAAKRPEYTEGNPDVLYNFKVVAEEIGITPEQVWYVYFRKHVASISQYAKDPTKKTAEPIWERISDCINYLEILAALHAERRIG